MSEHTSGQLARLRYPGGIDADGHILEPPDLWERYLEPKWTAPGRFGSMTSSRYAFFLNVTAGDSVRHAFTSFFQFGLLEKLPALKLVVLECGASWIGYWLDRMDSTWASPQGTLARQMLPERPSDYFSRQCWISADPDERTLRGVMEVVGDNVRQAYGLS